MPPLPFAAVLLSACFQAGWNLQAKRSSHDRAALIAVGWFALGLLLTASFLASGGPSGFQRGWLPYMLTSGLIHGAYICLLGRAYALGEISVVYPVARGFGVAGTTLLALALGLDRPSAAGLCGCAAIAGGTLAIGLGELGQAQRRSALLTALLVAATVAGYSLTDSVGAKHVPTLPYLASMNLVAALAAAPFLLSTRREALAAVWASGKGEAFLVAAAGSVAYGIVLWAFRNSPASYVAALREFSIVIASGLGVVVLKDRFDARKGAAIALITAGIVLIRLG